VHKKGQPGVDIRDGTAYALPVETGSADAVIVAQVSSFPMEIDDIGVPLVWQCRCIERVYEGVETRRIIRSHLEPLRLLQMASLSRKDLCTLSPLLNKLTEGGSMES